MSIFGKVKELGAEIAKTVEESGIKDNVKCATIIIKDTVEKGKNDLEGKIEEKNYEILITDIIEEVKKVKFVESKVVIQIINDLIEE